MRYWLLCLVVTLVACGGSGNKRETPLPASPSLPILDVTEVPATRIVRRTETPPPQPTPTPTALPEIQQAAGEKSLALRYTVTQGGPDAKVDEWIYTGRVTIAVQLNGTASGSGVLWPSAIDPDCVVIPRGTEADYAFDVQGQVEYDGSRLRLKIELMPHNPDAEEVFHIQCVGEPEEGYLVELNYLWPVLSQVEALSYTVFLDEIVSTLRYSEDVGTRTSGAFNGMLQIEAQLFQ